MFQTVFVFEIDFSLGVPTEKEVSNLMEEVSFMEKYSHMAWYLWAKVQKNQSHVDMDHDDYARKRYRQFLDCLARENVIANK